MICSVAFIATLNISCSAVQFAIQTAIHPVQQQLTYSRTGLKYLHKTMENVFKIRHSETRGKTYMFCGFLFTINFRPVSNTLAFL